MPDNKSAVDEFLGDLPNNDGDTTFDEQKSQNLFGDQQETEEVGEQKEEEEKIPFNKDPKVLRFIEKEISKRLSEVQMSKEEPTQKTIEEVDELTQAWTELIGNDDPAKQRLLQAIKKTFNQAEERGAARALEQIDSQRNAEIEAEQQAEQELAEGFESIEENFNVDLGKNAKLRNDFINFLERVAPKQGGEIVAYPDFIETFKTFQELKKPQPNTRARDIAARGVERPGDSTTEKPRGYSWKDVDSAFSNLFGK